MAAPLGGQLMSEPPVIKALRRAGAHDGHAASSRIDRVESMVSWMATTMVKALGPDALLENLGREQALAVLELAGQDTARITARWDAERAEREGRAPKQVSVKHTHPDEAGTDWRHDRRVLDATTLPDAEYQRVRREVQAEYKQRARQQAEQAEASPVGSNFMWYDSRTGKPVYGDRVAVPLGAPTDPYTGAPAHKTLTVNESVPPLGSEPVPPVSMSDVRAVPTVQPCIEHPGRPGERPCTVCGKPRPDAP
jgi:hypothetical protein